jgi:ABC-type phosphate transport system substrate-binding protein
VLGLLVLASLQLAYSPLAAGPAAGGTSHLVVIVNPGVPVSVLTASELEAIFTSSKRTWPDGSNIGAFSYAPDNDLRREFDKVVLRMSADEVARFWIDQRVRGGAPPPRQVPDPALAMRLVAKLPGCIAYIPNDLVNSTVKVVARISKGKVLAP